MARIDPLPRSQLPEYEDIFRGMEESIGYVPNSFLTMGRDPKILKAVGAMSEASWYTDAVTERMRRLVTYAYSHFAGSFYSSAHCATGAEKHGFSSEAILDVDHFKDSRHFSEAEKAVLRLCRNAARSPSTLEHGHVTALRQFYDERTIVAIVGLICFMAYLNKWNEICATTLEDAPRRYAEAVLSKIGWKLGPHG